MVLDTALRWLLHHCRPGLAGLALSMIALPVSAGLSADFLRAADQGKCIENIVHEMIRQRGAQQAAVVVQAAVAALAERAQQQRSLGCEGDIAAQAIAAGADPDEVLRATAAGL